jgi:hypothetical protein
MVSSVTCGRHHPDAAVEKSKWVEYDTERKSLDGPTFWFDTAPAPPEFPGFESHPIFPLLTVEGEHTLDCDHHIKTKDVRWDSHEMVRSAGEVIFTPKGVDLEEFRKALCAWISEDCQMLFDDLSWLEYNADNIAHGWFKGVVPQPLYVMTAKRAGQALPAPK